MADFGEDDGSSTQALAQPSREELEKAILQSQGGPCIPEALLAEPLALSCSIDFGDSPSSLNSPSDSDEDENDKTAPPSLFNEIPQLNIPSAANLPPINAEPELQVEAPAAAPSPEESLTPPVEQPAEPAAEPEPAPAEPQIAAPASPKIVAPAAHTPAAPPTIALAEPVKPDAPIPSIPDPVPEEDGPVFGGAASENNDLQFEDEGLDDLGEKTMMLDAAPDEDLEDIGNEKTQISMSAMDYDPLSGKLIVESGKTSQREYILVREKTSIGRAPNNDITISDIAMSRKHVEIDKFPEGFRLRDLDSGNGTVLNGYRIRVGQLRDGDIIEIGNVRFRFEQTGGDPDELWKGEPKIDYHPNQKNGVVPPTQGSSGPAPSRPAPSRPEPPAPSFSSRPEPPKPSAPQVSETMLERQGGGIAAPSWGGASPMTAPYMGAMNPSMLRNTPTPPKWALPVVLAMSAILIGTIVWAIMSISDYKTAEEVAGNHQKLVESISKKFNSSNADFKGGEFDNARVVLADARKLDSDNAVIKDPKFFDIYDELYAKEIDLRNEIDKIRNKNAKSYASNKQGIDELEKDLDFLQNEVPETSYSNRDLANRVYSSKQDIYIQRLRTIIDDDIVKNKLDEARTLIDKLSKLPETEKAVRQFRKKLEDKEKQS
ncbi:MAG: FHA domain-containing protein [Proteobacteria bacterium]|nr:FHA domain-containing protein [Pseudomonadota bacterium]